MAQGFQVSENTASLGFTVIPEATFKKLLAA
jgi:hypothetical protein